MGLSQRPCTSASGPDHEPLLTSILVESSFIISVSAAADDSERVMKEHSRLLGRLHHPGKRAHTPQTEGSVHSPQKVVFLVLLTSSTLYPEKATVCFSDRLLKIPTQSILPCVIPTDQLEGKVCQSKQILNFAFQGMREANEVFGEQSSSRYSCPAQLIPPSAA